MSKKKYIISVENLFRIEAESEDEARGRLRERLRNGEFSGEDEIVLTTHAETRE